MGKKMLQFDDVLDVPMQCEKCRFIGTLQPLYVAPRPQFDSEEFAPERMEWPCPRCGHRVFSECADDC